MNKLKNQVIEVLTREHGEKVIKYWQSQGVDTRTLKGILNKEARNDYRYYGVIDGEFSSYSPYEVEAAAAEIIELPEDSKSAIPNCEIEPTYAGMKCSYKGDLKNIPDPIVHKMLERQVTQGNPRDVSVFEKRRTTGRINGGFDWFETPEDYSFWKSVLNDGNYTLFFEKYPELAEAPQDAKVSVSIQNDELMDALNRIEAKLDQLLATPADTPCKGKQVGEQSTDFKLGDKVRVKSWKEIKAMTEKDLYGDRRFPNGRLFLNCEKSVCGEIGEVTCIDGSKYVYVMGEDWEYYFAPQALEKL